MKKLLLLAIAMWACVTADAALTALHIHTSTHGIVTILLDDEPVLTFNDDRSVTVEVPGDPESEPMRLDFDDIDKCEYGDRNDYVPEGVNDIVADKAQAITVRADASGVTFGNLPQGATVEIYNLSGIKVFNAPVCDNTFYLERSSLPHGIYVVRIGDFVTKLSL